MSEDDTRELEQYNKELKEQAGFGLFDAATIAFVGLYVNAYPGIGSTIHYDTANEYAGAQIKTLPVAEDMLLIEDSSDSWKKKRAPYPFGGGSDSFSVRASATDAIPGFLDVKVDGTTIQVVNNKLFVPGGSGDTFKVKATSTDPTAGFLDAKVDGTTVKVVSNQLVSPPTSKVMSSSTDPTPGYLDAKVDGTTVMVVDNKLVAPGGGGDTYTVKATATDSTPGYLNAKVDGTTIQVVSDKLVATAATDTYEVKATSTDPTPGFLDAKVDNNGIKVVNNKLALGVDPYIVKASWGDASPGYLNGKVDITTVTVVNDKLTVVRLPPSIVDRLHIDDGGWTDLYPEYMGQTVFLSVVGAGTYTIYLKSPYNDIYSGLITKVIVQAASLYSMKIIIKLDDGGEYLNGTKGASAYMTTTGNTDTKSLDIVWTKKNIIPAGWFVSNVKTIMP